MADKRGKYFYNIYTIHTARLFLLSFNHKNEPEVINKKTTDSRFGFENAVSRVEKMMYGMSKTKVCVYKKKEDAIFARIEWKASMGMTQRTPYQ